MTHISIHKHTICKVMLVECGDRISMSVFRREIIMEKGLGDSIWSKFLLLLELTEESEEI